MKSVVIFVSLLTLALEERIVDGEETTIEKHPSQVSIQVLGIHVCGGSIINSFSVLSAAHCTGNLPAAYKIRAGSTSYDSGGQVIQVDQIVPHELYDATTRDCDIAILKLASELIFGTYAAPIAIAPYSASEGDSGAVIGWVPGSNNLQKTVVTTVRLDECNFFNGFSSNTDRMLCSKQRDVNGGGCWVDSGGPLINLDNQMTGVVTWIHSCTRFVSNNVPKLSTWIVDNSKT